MAAARSHGVEVGAGTDAPVMLVFFDSQCDYCGELWQQSVPLLDRVKMKWIPVGLLNRKSVEQGAAVLGAADPVAAMELHTGPSMPAASDENRKKVQLNTALLKAFGGKGVPHFLYRNVGSGGFGEASGVLTTERLRMLLGV